MANKIETELLEATGLKKKVGENFQKFAGRLITAVHELAEDDWNDLSDDAQDWINVGAKAVNRDKDVAKFPADEEPAEEDEPAAEEEPAEEDEPAEEEAPRRGSRRAAKDEEPDEEDRPARGGRRAAKEEEPEDEPAPRRGARRTAKEEPEEEAPKRGTRTRTRAKEPEEDEAPKRGARTPAKKTAAKREPAKPAARSRKEPEGKAASATTLLKKMLIKNPKMSTDEILEVLDEKHDLQPTKMAIASIRSAFIHSMKVLNEAGHLSEKMADKLPA